MVPDSEKNKKWREKNKAAITKWRATIDELRNLENLENWHYERFDIEVAIDTAKKKMRYGRKKS